VAWRTRLLNSEEECEEVVARAWAGIVQNVRKNPGNIRSFKAVSVSAIRNCARTLREELKRRGAREIGTESPESQDEEVEEARPLHALPLPTPEAVIIENSRQASMRKLLEEIDGELSKRDRLILRLMLEDCESSEIAAVLQIKVGAVDTAQTRLRQRLKALLEARGYSSLKYIE
jgi:RNA polymerase sigma factor (sigma-70 family)